MVRKSTMNPAPQLPSTVGMKLLVAGRAIDFSREALLDADGQVIDLRPQAYQVLRHLALNVGRLVSKDELLAAVWPQVVVTDDSLVQAISDVRRALGEAGHQVLKTVPRRGYLLVADATAADASEEPEAVQPIPQRGWRPGVLGAMVTLAGIAAALWAGVAWRSVAPVTAHAPARPSIAVLAFKDPRSDPDGELLARGFAEELVTELARGPDLRVVSHQSSFQFAGSATPVAEIGRRLRSRYLVDGNVGREGDQLRIVVELLDSEDGRVVWSSSRSVRRELLPTAQRAVASRIAGTLLSKVRRTEERHALQLPPKTLDVVVLTERGKSLMVRYSAEGIRNARSLYEQALVLDPDYAPAWANLGIANTVDAGLRLTGEWTRDRLPEVLAQIHKSLALDPELALGWVALSQAQALARNYSAAIDAARRCFDVSPNDADCFYILGKAQLETGDPLAAVHNMEEALDRNPMPPAYLSAFYATALWGSRRFDDAIRAADECLARAPAFWRCRQDRLAALVELGRLDDARQEARRLMAQVPTMTAERFGFFAASAAELRDRRMAAASTAGIPTSKAPGSSR
jgi:TolB-like protein/DNA-binding winged helix-turn-helix (wHTH) protein/Flp pilus assembly protein TadD